MEERCSIVEGHLNIGLLKGAIKHHNIEVTLPNGSKEFKVLILFFKILLKKIGAVLKLILRLILK